VNILLYDETTIDRFWGAGHSAKWMEEARSGISRHHCHRDSVLHDCTVALVNRTRANFRSQRRSHVHVQTPPVFHAVSLLAVGDASKLRRLDLDRAFSQAVRWSATGTRIGTGAAGAAGTIIHSLQGAANRPSSGTSGTSSQFPAPPLPLMAILMTEGDLQ